MKAITGKNYTFKWFAPSPLSGVPTVTFNLASPVSSSMTSIRSSIAVSAIANDRRTLTIANQTNGLQNDEVEAYFLTSGDSYFAVKLSRIVGTTAILSDPLPKEIDLSTSGTLEFAMYYYVASSSNVTATSQTITYSVEYTVDLGALNELRKDSSILKITPRPFETGLTHDILVGQYNQLAGMIPRRQTDLRPQIKRAMIELIFALRDHLQPLDCTEDEIFNPETFRQAHVYLTTAIVYEGSDKFDLGQQYRDRATQMIDLALRSVSLDENGDGIIDSGELDRRESGGSKNDLRASFAGYTKTEYDKRFTAKRGMRH